MTEGVKSEQTCDLCGRDIFVKDSPMYVIHKTMFCTEHPGLIEKEFCKLCHGCMCKMEQYFQNCLECGTGE